MLFLSGLLFLFSCSFAEDLSYSKECDNGNTICLFPTDCFEPTLSTIAERTELNDIMRLKMRSYCPLTFQLSLLGENEMHGIIAQIVFRSRETKAFSMFADDVHLVGCTMSPLMVSSSSEENSPNTRLAAYFEDGEWHSSIGELECSFKKPVDTVLEYLLNQKITYEINQQKEKQRKYLLNRNDVFMSTNPNVMFDLTNFDPTKKYEEVRESSGRFYCENSMLFTLEYRKIGSEKYIPASQMHFENGNFIVGNETMKTVAARCAADAKYFCNYGVKWEDDPNEKEIYGNFISLNKAPLIFKEPIINQQVAASVSCPPGYYLMQNDMPLGLAVQFECRNFDGENLFWSFMKGNERIFLDQWKKEYYCEFKVDCNTLRESGIYENLLPPFVSDGYTGEFGEPKCLPGSTLKLLPRGREVSKVSCDSESEKYDITLKNGKREILPINETSFICEYNAGEGIV